LTGGEGGRQPDRVPLARAPVLGARAVAHYLDYARTWKKPSTFEGDSRHLAFIAKASWTGELLSRVQTDAILRWVAERQRSREVIVKRRRRPGETVAQFRKATDRRENRTLSGATGATVNRDLALCSALYTWAIQAGHAEENPFKRVKRFREDSEGRGIDLSPEEARALVTAAPAALRLYLIAALSTARRRGALLALRWRDVDLERRAITFRAAADKARRFSVVPMTDDLHHLLVALDEERQRHDLDANDPVFRLPDGRPLDGWQLRRLWEPTIARCVSIPFEKRGAFRIHDLRHTAASLLVRAGVPLHELMRIGGWSTYKMVLRYAHLAPESGRKAVNALGGILGFGNCAGLLPRIGADGGASAEGA